MRRAVEILLNEMTSKMSGYAVMMQYRFMNLCVKAEPASLLSLTIRNSEGDNLNIEDAAGVILNNEYQFEVMPHSDDLLFPISKAIVVSHPEFKQEIITADDDKKLFIKDGEERHIVVTMPEVNKDRHDVLMDAVKALYDECTGQIDKVRATYLVKLGDRMEGQPAADYDEAKEALEKSYDQHKDIIKTYRENKEKEIEDAYQKWLSGKEEKEQQQKEKDEAMDSKVAGTMNFIE